MSDVARVEIEIEKTGTGAEDAKEDIKSVGDAAEEAGAKAQSAGKATEGATQSVGSSWKKAALAVAAAVYSAKKAIDAYVDTARSQIQLNKSLENSAGLSGVALRKTSKDLDNFANDTEKAFGISDGAVRRAAGRFASAGVPVKDLKKLLTATANTAAATGKDFESTANLLQRAYERPLESIGQLRRAGISLSETQLQGKSADEQRAIVLDELSKRFGGLGEAMKSADGGLTDIETGFGNVLEAVGGQLLSAFAPILEAVAGFLDFLSQTPGLATAAAAAITALGIALTVGTGPLGIILATGTLLIGLFASLSTSTQALRDSIANAALAADSLAQTQADTTAMQSQVEGLARLKEGTDQYRGAVEALLTQYPQLADKGINLRSSYEDIKKAVDSLTESMLAQEQIKLAQRYDELSDSVGALASRYVEMVRLRAKAIAEDPTGKSKKYLDALTREKAALADLNDARETIVKSGKVLGYSEEEIQKSFGKSETALKDYQEELNTTGDKALPEMTGAVAATGAALDPFAVDLGTAGEAIGLAGDAAYVAGDQAANAYRTTSDAVGGLLGGLSSMAAILAKIGTAAPTKTDSGPKKTGGGGGGSFYNIQADRAAAEINAAQGVAKKRLEIQREYDEKVEQIEKARFRRRGEREEAFELARGELARRTNAANEEDRKARFEATNDAIQDAISFASSAFDKAINGDILPLITDSVTKVGALFGPLGQTIAAGINLGIQVVDALWETSAEKAEARFQKFLERVNRELGDAAFAKSGLDFYSRVFPEDKAGQIEAALVVFNEQLGAAAKVLSAENLSADNLDQFARLVPGITKAFGEGKKSARAFYDANRQALDALGISAGDFDRLFRLAKEGQLDLFDILNGTLDAQEALNALKEDEVAIDGRANLEAEKKKALADASFAALLASKTELERDITTGAVQAGTAGAVTEEARILQGLIDRAKALGLSRDYYFQFEEQLAKLVGGVSGAAFGALSGTGMSAASQFERFYGGAGGGGGGTTYQGGSVVVNGGQRDTLGWQQILESIQRETGVRVATGGI